MTYFDYKRQLKQQIRFYQEVEEEQLKFIDLYKAHITVAKENQCSRLLTEARLLLDQTLYLYHSVKQDRLELQNDIQSLID